MPKNPAPVAFRRLEGHGERAAGQISEEFANFSPFRILAVDFDLEGPKDRFVAPSSKTSRGLCRERVRFFCERSRLFMTATAMMWDRTQNMRGTIPSTQPILAERHESRYVG